MLVSYVFMDELKLDCFDLYPLNRPRASKYVIHIGRIRKQRDRDAKKAAKEANKLKKKKQYQQKKGGELPLQF